MTIDTPRAARKINHLLDLQPGSIVLVSSNLGDSAFKLVVDNDIRSRAWVSGVMGQRMRDADLAEFAEDITHFACRRRCLIALHPRAFPPLTLQRPGE